ncbi:T9SS type A sorting domain-containing protein, partial [Roseivirga sp.]|uniref:T9SS type A sorting domain-containing protein n=1 Tax=Roseivirga sp. TaxID=1964215 RepID=UPI003B8BD547
DISALGLSQERTITITNDGEIPVEVRTISTPVGFEAIPGALILSVGTSADVTISFVPTEARAYSGNIVFEYSFDDQKVNLTHAVTGEGAVITSVDNGSINAANISIYPNPADRLLTIDLSEINAGKLDIEIINTTGVKLFGIDGFTEKELRLDVSSYEAGIYIVQFNNGTSIVRKKVMIKR